MRVLDLFSGLGGFSQAFKDRGHSVTTFDINPDFHADYQGDIMRISRLEPEPDIILASPPCQTFSMMSLAKYWNIDNTPKNETAHRALALVLHTRNLIEQA